MGVDTIIRLPENVEINHVADVIGILAGLKAEKKNFQRSEGWYVEVDGVNILGRPSIPDGPEITFKSPLDGENHSVSYWYEDSEGGRMLSPHSTAFWIAIGRGLVKFFGGTLVYKDTGNMKPNFRGRPKSDALNRPQDGKPWQNLQQRLLDLKPLTQKDLKAESKHAAYGDD
jgi:hypothetical protein